MKILHLLIHKDGVIHPALAVVLQRQEEKRDRERVQVRSHYRDWELDTVFDPGGVCVCVGGGGSLIEDKRDCT